MLKCLPREWHVRPWVPSIVNFQPLSDYLGLSRLFQGFQTTWHFILCIHQSGFLFLWTHNLTQTTHCKNLTQVFRYFGLYTTVLFLPRMYKFKIQMPWQMNAWFLNPLLKWHYRGFFLLPNHWVKRSLSAYLLCLHYGQESENWRNECEHCKIWIRVGENLNGLPSTRTGTYWFKKIKANNTTVQLLLLFRISGIPTKRKENLIGDLQWRSTQMCQWLTQTLQLALECGLELVHAKASDKSSSVKAFQENFSSFFSSLLCGELQHKD